MNWKKPQFTEKIGYHVEFGMEMRKSNDDEIINIELDEKDIDQHVLAKKLKIDIKSNK